MENKVADVPIFISLSSWLHGLNTSLGQSFFEKVGQILCNGEKREFKGLKISRNQQTKISDIMADLKNKKRLPNMEKGNEELLPDRELSDKEIEKVIDKVGDYVHWYDAINYAILNAIRD